MLAQIVIAILWLGWNGLLFLPIILQSHPLHAIAKITYFGNF